MTEEEKLLAQFNGVADAIEYQLENNDWGKFNKPVLFISSRGKAIYTSLCDASDAKETPHAKVYPASYFYDADEDTGIVFIDKKVVYTVAAEWVFLRTNKNK